MLILVDFSKNPADVFMVLLVHLVMLLATMSWVAAVGTLVFGRLALLLGCMFLAHCA
jgi:hypothetical protein